MPSCAAIPRSPAWHRRLRAKRSKARQRIWLRRRHSIAPKTKDLILPAQHHTAPAYKELLVHIYGQDYSSSEGRASRWLWRLVGIIWLAEVAQRTAGSHSEPQGSSIRPDESQALIVQWGQAHHRGPRWSKQQTVHCPAHAEAVNNSRKAIARVKKIESDLLTKA